MHSLFFFPIISILFLLQIPSIEASFVEISLTCHNETDFYWLLYGICRETVLCRELYYLEPPGANLTQLAQERDFRKFHYQLSLISFFSVIQNSTDPPSPNNTGSPHHHHHHQHQYYYHHHGDGASIIEDIWPPEWAPNITVTYVGTGNNSIVSCSEAFNALDPSNALLIYTSIDVMKSYKLFISNEHYCNDYNERPLYDPYSGRFHCVCSSGKICYKEGNWRELIFVMTLGNGAILIVLIIAVILVGFLFLPNHRP